MYQKIIKDGVNFPLKTYENDIPKEKNSDIGKSTRFKKGIKNRKLKTTLIK